jgi:hypothetical protein
MYQSAPSLDALMNVPDAVAPKIKEAGPDADREFGEICGAHEDYIWEAGIGSRGAGLIPEERGKVGISVYFYCDMSKEERADEIVEEAFAPIYNSHVEKGNIASWGWLKHDFGGKWRRVGTMTGSDIASLLAARNRDLRGRQCQGRGREQRVRRNLRFPPGLPLEHRARDAVVCRLTAHRTPPPSGGGFFNFYLCLYLLNEKGI